MKLFSFFRKPTLTTSAATIDLTAPLSLADRKAYRRELLYGGIRETLLTLEVLSGMYKFKVMNLDRHHQRFIVMMDVTRGFKPMRGTQPLGLYEVESLIRDALSRSHALAVEAVYWRVLETEQPFARGTRAGDSPRTAAHFRQTMGVNAASAPAQGAGLSRRQPVAGNDLGGTQYGTL